MSIFKTSLLISMVFLLVCCVESPEKENLPEETGPYFTSIKEYRTELLKSRKNGYLQLVGLMKMDKDEMSFGRDASNYLQLNVDRIPTSLGTFVIADSVINFKADEGVTVKYENDLFIDSVPLPLDKFGSSASLYAYDVRWQIITRNEQPYLRVWDTKNPEIESFKGFEFFPLNEDMLFEADFRYFETTKSEKVDSQLGPKTSTDFIGQVLFEYNGENYSLDVGNNGFTMVADKTTGNESYGGGRYVYLELPEKDGKLILDFNKLYNPPCAFNKFTTCLYPPRQNELPFNVEAGETITRAK